MVRKLFQPLSQKEVIGVGIMGNKWSLDLYEFKKADKGFH